MLFENSEKKYLSNYQEYFKYNINTKSFFSLPYDKDSLSFLNMMIKNKIQFNYFHDYTHELDSNYMNESLLDFDGLSHAIQMAEMHLKNYNFEFCLRLLKVIFYSIDYNATWRAEIDYNDTIELIFIDLSYLTNKAILGVVLNKNMKKKVLSDDEFGNFLVSFIKEIELFSRDLIENLNFFVIRIFSFANFVELLNTQKDMLKEIGNLFDQELDENGRAYCIKIDNNITKQIKKQSLSNKEEYNQSFIELDLNEQHFNIEETNLLTSANGEKSKSGKNCGIHSKIIKEGLSPFKVEENFQKGKLTYIKYYFCLK